MFIKRKVNKSRGDDRLQVHHILTHSYRDHLELLMNVTCMFSALCGETLLPGDKPQAEQAHWTQNSRGPGSDHVTLLL